MNTEMITAFFAGLVLAINAIGLIFIKIYHDKNEAKLDEIHGLVNSRLTEALEEVKQLRAYIGGFSFHEVKKGTVEQGTALEASKIKTHGAAQ